MRRTYTYDGLGRVQRDRLEVDTALTFPSFLTFLTDFEYDLLGQVTQITHPDDATVIRYEYEGRYLERVCDLGGASSCSGTGAEAVVSDVEYDGLGRRWKTHWEGGTRTFTYDADTHRLEQDRFDGTSDPPYWFQRNYAAYDELGNITEITGISQAEDVNMAESYTYDRRNRLLSWTKGSTTYGYEYDALGNLTNHAGEEQVYAPTTTTETSRRSSAEGRPGTSGSTPPAGWSARARAREAAT
jgi:YD repeat-containing protein